MTNKKTATTVHSFRVLSDASGAPAVISRNGFKWAFDLVGRDNITRTGLAVGGLSGPRQAALAICTARYRAELAGRVDAAWLATNATMYAEAAE